MSTLKELNAKKKELKSTLKRLEGSGASKQQIGRVQYKLNQVMKEKPDRRITKRKTPLTGSPSAGTGRKKRGPDMYAEAVALGKPKGKGTGIVKSTAKAFAAPQAKVVDLSANKRAGLVRQQGSQAGKANSLKLRELKDTLRRMKASGSSGSALSNIKAKIAKLQG